ncbi:MAG: hypothetical protein JO305_00430 [Alphaproteobacteria bacterium]|nr:hypothetical protein [Alphaproteobacteria bacterium]
MTTPAVADLRDKRAEIAGQIRLMHKQLAQLRIDLAHVEAALRILEPGIDLDRIAPRRVEFRPRYFKRGALTRLILDYLRERPGETIATADIMPSAIGVRNLNGVDYRRVEVVVYEALRKLGKRGIVAQTGQGAKAARFRVL